ncbi:MAG: thiamine diphosphokinase [Mesorhizobium sp.]|uniref:thiamine diphosphokinase n=2 Tax=Mesorhizobium TaxID=68287 RepID=UPI000F75BA66|nr:MULTISPECIES: thiamine diphosphokinase [unclassified Mesorhizobium]AZO50565.1 thiamine diphosphokinase [Mesorhizobium sp. M4B.F.Ca.ET.058.02.1.1]RVC41884.1 thiamine diphosphokinase [Mesorhizobium sp. M4A.F.Ca.ET.090.04.2.1]RVD36632.1 thiamine diphosphokinase [Mesorhizobium sp. M4A.F.Ca.ET.020.02.1.1]RWC10136.1 MAG: thiamine diphosphokinase [Mesorhizobium sp.]RWC37815.1 MAG: thiamine diphosphokinase [Mesorhizobium sp.]
MGTFTILLGGDLVRTPRLDSQLAGARVIAADGGIGHARMLGLTPELWVGDFDSVPPDLPDDLAAVPRQVFPAEKDKTDGELAIAAALERGATGLVLAGAFGGKRADHAFLHLALAVRLAEAGMSVVMTSGAQEGIPLLPGKAGFDYADGTLFSVLGFSDLSGLSVAGAKWPLDHVEVTFGSSLTISNEVKGRLEIALGHGRALLLAHPYPLPES